MNWLGQAPAPLTEPGQTVLLFTGPTGVGTLVRHGIVTRGDILVIEP